jgi:hypothetical protein
MNSEVRTTSIIKMAIDDMEERGKWRSRGAEYALESMIRSSMMVCIADNLSRIERGRRGRR